MRRGFLIAILLILPRGKAGAQQPALPPALPGGAGDLGTIPGQTRPRFEATQPEGFLGGRPGASVPRVPFSVVRPPSLPSPGEVGIAPLPESAPVELPLYGPLRIPEAEELGPPGGLTLEAAIDRLLRENLELRARALELPQADADVVTAGLRANPIFFADGQLIPYRPYTEERRGGPTQYDVNITLPLDLSGKRRARVRSATETRRILEAQYHDAVRLQVDRLCSAFVDAVAAREVVRFAEASLGGLEDVLEKSRALYEQGAATRVDVNRIRIQRETARVALADSEESLHRAKLGLAELLNIPPAQADAIEPVGSLLPSGDSPPPTEGLIELALVERPDLRAYRLGVGLARADLQLALANRFEDVFLLYQPFTLQEREIDGQFATTSWALGVTVPLPIFNRNQGNIRRAQLNTTQTQTELEAVMRRVLTEVLDAEREYYASLAIVRQIEDELLPATDEILEDSYRLFLGGEADAIDYLNARRDANEVIRQYFTSLVRHRRSVFALNTAVGRMILR